MSDSRGDGVCIALIGRQRGKKESGHKHVGDETRTIDLKWKESAAWMSLNVAMVSVDVSAKTVSYIDNLEYLAESSSSPLTRFSVSYARRSACWSDKQQFSVKVLFSTLSQKPQRRFEARSLGYLCLYVPRQLT